MKIFSFSPFGYEGALVAVEVDLRRGIPCVDVVGLADGAVKESRERMRSAIRNSGFEFPLERVLISLSPADLKKEGAGFDLALALAVLDAQKKEQGSYSEDERKVLVMGELELSGLVRPVRGVNAAACSAVALGICECIVCSENAREAQEVDGMRVFAAENLAEAFDSLYKSECFTKFCRAENDFDSLCDCVDVDGIMFPKVLDELEFKYVKGQKKLLRGLQIAAAGGHNLLAYGPPGCGKTLALQRFSSLLPLLLVEEAQSVTRIHSLAGLLPFETALMRKPDFRMPHQTASIEGICGGGINCRPGEISLAHNGVLFLDEAAEFKSSVLQMLRVPLESGCITLSRAGRNTVYPADFQLLMASNPCPCGNYGVPGKICLCSARSIEMYWKKFSGPLLDRIELRVFVCGEDDKNYKEEEISTQSLRVDIAKAVKIQRKRGKKNAKLLPEEMDLYCTLGDEESAYFENEVGINGFSRRAGDACIKIARTICDMEGRGKIAIRDLKEAFSFRSVSGPLEDFSD
ncbi:YifB family Mg chelatase-like AAA ATPase [Treponema pectinovorum]|uniref:YifB family Mg chelatase-like AAA ATPase n=1 Tax=Treponema pectinovorum TaxID=164 RepID=UPI0011CA6A1A|nr:YifB family Mg chelatase-like AAA ATPase [Treponema pectinovorum]